MTEPIRPFLFHTVPAVLLSVLSAGCAATRFSSTETLASVRPSETLVRSFHVEDVKGGICLPSKNVSRTVLPSAGDVNQLLGSAYPTVFNRKEGSVPLHIVCEGTVAPLGFEDEPSYFSLLFWRHQTGGKVSVSVLLDNHGSNRTVRVPYRESRTESIALFPLVAIPGRRNWPTVYGLFPSALDLHPVFAELVAVGVVKALNRMDEGQMALLVEQAYVSPERRRLLDWLTRTPAVVVTIREDGSAIVFEENQRSFVLVPVPAARLPEIRSQRFSAESRRGRIEADVTDCDPSQAADYLLLKLLPAICRTKNVVFDPSALPPEGAQYRVLATRLEERDGKSVATIEFETLR